MAFFLIAYLALYGILNLYVFSLVVRGYGWRRHLTIGFWAVAALMTAAPVAARLLDTANLFGLARAVSLTGSVWMLVVLWCLAGGLLMEAWNGVLWLAALGAPEASRWRIRHKVALPVLIACGVALTVYGFREAADVRLKAVRLQSSRIPADSGPVRILQLSDLHLGLHVREAQLARVLNLIRKAQPDVLVVTGDLFDSGAPHVKPLIERFRQVEPPFGKYLVTGNHEQYAGLQSCLNMAREAGFTALRGERAAVRCRGAVILFAGVDFPGTPGMPEAMSCDELRVLPQRDRQYFTVLLKHLPAVHPSASGRFDLQLSGHTHGGQIFPFGLFVRLFYRYMHGAYQVSPESLLYVTTGAGTWGPPVRVLARPEVTLFIIESSLPVESKPASR
jgi:uncharacterized protein